MFGKTVVCPNLQIASQYARTGSLNGVTLDGDRSDRKGALTGGYHDTKRSRIEASRRYKKFSADALQHQASTLELTKRLDILNQQITQVLSSLKNAKARLSDSSGSHNWPNDLQQVFEQIEIVDKRVAAKEQKLQEVKTELVNLQKRVESMSEESKSAFSTTFNETDRLVALHKDLDRLRQANSQASLRRLQLQASKNELEELINKNLQPQLDYLQSVLTSNYKRGDINAKEIELQVLRDEEARFVQQLESMDTDLESSRLTMQNLIAEKTDLKVCSRNLASLI